MAFVQKKNPTCDFITIFLTELSSLICYSQAEVSCRLVPVKFVPKVHACTKNYGGSAVFLKCFIHNLQLVFTSIKTFLLVY